MLEVVNTHGDDPSDDDQIHRDSAGDTGGSPDRFAADKRIKSDPNVRKYILAMCLYGATGDEILAGLHAEFGINGKRNLGARQRAKMDEYRAEFPDNTTITPELEIARKHIVEHRPESAWRLLPEPRALIASLLRDTTATSVQIQNISARFVKTIDPKLKGVDYDTLTKSLARPGWSRETMADFLVNNPMPVGESLASGSRTRAEYELQKESKFAAFTNAWIFDDSNRALLVALLDLGREKASPPAIAAVLNSEVEGANVTPSFIYIRSEAYGSYKAFADYIRIGTDEIAPGLHDRAEALIERFETDKRERNQPEWLRTEEMKAFAGVLLGETELSYALIAWASGAKFGNETQLSTVKEHTRTHGGRRDFALELLSGVSTGLIEQARLIDLRALEGYDGLTAIQKQSIGLEMSERFEPMRKIVNSLSQKSASTVSRVFLYYLSQGRVPQRTEGTPDVRPEDITIVPSVRIEFAGDAVGGAGDVTKKADEDARELWKRLTEELGRLERSEQIRRMSPLVRALVQSSENEPILHVALKRTTFEKGKQNDEMRTFDFDQQYMNRLKKRAFSADE